MMRRYIFMLLCTYITSMVTTCFSMGTTPPVFTQNKSLSPRIKPTKYNNATRDKERTNSSYSHPVQNKFNTIPKSVQFEQANKASQNQMSYEPQVLQPAKPIQQVPAQNLYIKQKSLPTKAAQNQMVDDLPKRAKSSSVQDFYVLETIDNEQFIPEDLYAKQKNVAVEQAKKSTQNQINMSQSAKFASPQDDLYLAEEIDANEQTASSFKSPQDQNAISEFIPLSKAKSSINPNEKTSIYLKTPTKRESLNQLNNNNLFIDMSEHIPEQATGKIENMMKKTLFIIIKKFLRLAAIGYVTEVSFADIITDYLKDIVFDFSNLPHSIEMAEDISFINLKMQIQYVAQQIKNYNNKTVYTSPDDMLNLIQYINQYLKENRTIFFSQAMFKKLDEVLTTAKTCCDIIRNKNIILTSLNTPQSVVLLFQPVIENTNKLSNISYSHNVMHAIYDKNGYMDDIMETWINFKSSDLNKMTLNDHHKAMNYQYAAFLTFLLLFQNSMVAAAIIIDESSALYKAANPVPVIINIA